MEVVGRQFPCPRESCGFSSLSYNRLLTHIWERHGIYSSFQHTCNISSCTRKFTSLQSFRRHLKSKHTSFYDAHLRRYGNQCEGNEDVDEVVGPEGNEGENWENPNEIVDAQVIVRDNNEDLPLNPPSFSGEECDNIVSQFLLEMREKFNTTQQVISFVSEQVFKIIQADRTSITSRIKESFLRNNENLNIDYETDCLLSSASPFCSSFQKFQGEKKLDTFVFESDFYVKPTEIPLGVNNETFKQESFQYIPLFETLKQILKHEDVLSVLLSSNQSPFCNVHEKVYSSFKDGVSFAKNQLFSRHPFALQIILYHDDFNIVNPLGNKTEKFKVSAFYFVLGNVPAKYNARLRDIHLLLLCPAAHINKYGYDTVLEPLLTDIKLLETEGLTFAFHGQDHHFYGTVTMVIADNLAAHALGGYFCNFSTVERVCRFCNFRKSQAGEGLPIRNFCLRTKEAYENNLQALEEDPSYASLYGIKSGSCLNELNYFHITSGLPPDLAHDVFEGVAVDIVYHLIYHCVETNYFTIDEVNNIILKFPYSQNDSVNKPQPFKGSSLGTLRIKETACEMWNLLRLLPLMLGDLVDPNDKHWLCFLKFLDIVERLGSLKFVESDLLMLQSLLDDFIQECLNVIEDFRVKPKAHFLQHYPQMIRVFGPLVKTLRFESKHSYFKALAKINKNRKNLCYSLAKRHQMNMSLHYRKELLLEHDTSSVYIKEVALECLQYPFQEVLQFYLDLSGNCLLSTSKSIYFEGHKYGEGAVIVVDFVSDEPLFGRIDSVWYFQTYKYLLYDLLVINKFNLHYHAYEVEMSGIYEMKKIEDIYDYHSLSLYRVNDLDLVAMHHHISF